MDKMTIKQQKFAEDYLIHGNATQAYYNAGYKANNDNIAAVESHKLLRNPKVSFYIESAAQQRARDNGITAEYVLNGIKSIADKDDARETDKLKAFELLGKHLKLFTDKIEERSDTTLTIRLEGDAEEWAK